MAKKHESEVRACPGANGWVEIARVAVDANRDAFDEVACCQING